MGSRNCFKFYLNASKNFGFSLTFKRECIHVFMLYKELIFKKPLCHQNTNSSIVLPKHNLLLFQLILSTAPSVIILVSQWALRSLLLLLLSNTSPFSLDSFISVILVLSPLTPFPPLHIASNALNLDNYNYSFSQMKS